MNCTQIEGTPDEMIDLIFYSRRVVFYSLYTFQSNRNNEIFFISGRQKITLFISCLSDLITLLKYSQKTFSRSISHSNIFILNRSDEVGLELLSYLLFIIGE